jgi:hypothetical protein
VGCVTWYMQSRPIAFVDNTCPWMHAEDLHFMVKTLSILCGSPRWEGYFVLWCGGGRQGLAPCRYGTLIQSTLIHFWKFLWIIWHYEWFASKSNSRWLMIPFPRFHLTWLYLYLYSIKTKTAVKAQSFWLDTQPRPLRLQLPARFRSELQARIFNFSREKMHLKYLREPLFSYFLLFGVYTQAEGKFAERPSKRSPGT